MRALWKLKILTLINIQWIVTSIDTVTSQRCSCWPRAVSTLFSLIVPKIFHGFNFGKVLYSLPQNVIIFTVLWFWTHISTIKKFSLARDTIVQPANCRCGKRQRSSLGIYINHAFFIHGNFVCDSLKMCIRDSHHASPLKQTALCNGAILKGIFC